MVPCNPYNATFEGEDISASGRARDNRMQKVQAWIYWLILTMIGNIEWIVFQGSPASSYVPLFVDQVFSLCENFIVNSLQSESVFA